MSSGPQSWQVNANTIHPQIVTTAGTNIYVQPQGFQMAPAAPPPEPTPLEWLRGQVDEMRETALAP